LDKHTIRLKAFSNEKDGFHTISLFDKTCDCSEFALKVGRCPHLDALGIFNPKPFTPKTHPTFSQALSGLVKSIRIRKIDQAVYWLIYLDTFRGAEYRFRTARRLLIGSAEDGHSVVVMEKLRERFSTLISPRAQVMDLVKEAIRICKLPPWWSPDSGGPDYIRSSLLGERLGLYHKWDLKKETAIQLLKTAVEEQDKAAALMACGLFWKTTVKFSATKQAEVLLRIAQSRHHDLAARLCRVHLNAKSALSFDNNFICQAAWMMAGGSSPVAEKILPVTVTECVELLAQARERWKNPHPIPRYCCDGIHSSGDDPRFIGMLGPMWAVCQAFNHYGRVSPDDVWLPAFTSYEGLIIDGHDDAAGGI
jgi:hypothetical protein